jgi:RNA-directed DNA polymerase
VRKALGRGRRAFACFLPAASPKALTFIGRTIRRWTLHHHSDKSLQVLAETYNTYIQGWINYNFYRTQLRPTLKRIDLYVIRWARRKFKRLRSKTKGARAWFDRLRRANPTRSLAAMSWKRPNIGSRVNREVHARFWERLGVRFLRATRHSRR